MPKKDENFKKLNCNKRMPKINEIFKKLNLRYNFANFFKNVEKQIIPHDEDFDVYY